MLVYYCSPSACLSGQCKSHFQIIKEEMIILADFKPIAQLSSIQAVILMHRKVREQLAQFI